MSATIPALIVTLVGALVSTANLVGPPSLPPEQQATEQQPPPPPTEDGQPDPEAPPEGTPEDPNPPGRTALPPGLQPVPFPLESQRHTPPPTGDDPNATPP
ncbi:MAG TPA: hypothetical protein VM869_17470, partial [Enhygromyxa sp.]|nr:hypothetical protein [Enhygromyxa sp.]